MVETMIKDGIPEDEILSPEDIDNEDGASESLILPEDLSGEWNTFSDRAYVYVCNYAIKA